MEEGTKAQSLSGWSNIKYLFDLVMMFLDPSDAWAKCFYNAMYLKCGIEYSGTHPAANS